MQKGRPHIVPRYVTYAFFTLGLVSAIAFRAIIVFQHLEPRWVRPVWYFAVVGYFFFFFYRYKISHKRKLAIRDFGLIEKVQANACLSDEDREVVLYLLTSMKVSPEDMNYAIIFVLSVIAIAADIVLSLM